MTKIILTGLTLATILFTIGISSQSFAMPMPDKTQDIIQSYVLAKDTTQQQMMLVSDPLTTKGGKAIFHLIPRPQEGIDGIPIQTPTNSPDLILASVPTPGGGTMLKWIPKPQEGIDGIPIPKTADPPTMLVAEPVTIKGGIAVLHLVPRPAP